MAQDIRTSRTALIVREMLNPYSHNRRPGKVVSVRYFDTAYEAAEASSVVEPEYWIDFEYNA